MKPYHVFARLGWLALLLLVATAIVAATAGLAATAGVVQADDAARRHRFYMPVVTRGKPPAPSRDCSAPDQQFGSLSVIGPSLTVNPEKDPNLNLGVRGYKQVSAPLKLVELGPVYDRNAPQIPGMFADRRTPKFTGTYLHYNWDEDCDCPSGVDSPWDATVLGMKTGVGEVIYTPDSGYDIEGGNEYLVMYASEERVTLHVGREDEFFGYVVHIEGVCVDPDLVSLYRRLDDEGRRYLPALRGHQPFGRAIGSEIRIAVRDTGSFMDPRSRNDWWQGR